MKNVLIILSETIQGYPKTRNVEYYFVQAQLISLSQLSR